MKDPGFCGIEGIVTTGKYDPMWPACKVHDYDYDEHIAGRSSEASSWKADKKFWKNMGRIIRKKKWYWKPWLQIQRVSYFSVVRVVGIFRWKRIAP